MASFCGEKRVRGELLTLGQFALVSYIPDPLARFLDDLRIELTPDCKPRAHVTILPPRPLAGELKEAVGQIARDTKGMSPFRVRLGEIEIFDKSQVVYLGIAEGVTELREFYHALNHSALEYKEPFPYHPHITIAQNICADDAAPLAAIARERWADYRGPRDFVVSSLSFVQHVAPSIWTDVAAVSLGVEVPGVDIPVAP
jgi:2'-5' RNA ligase